MRMEDMSLSGLDNSKLESQDDVIKYNTGPIVLHHIGGWRPDITNKPEWRRARQSLPKKKDPQYEDSSCKKAAIEKSEFVVIGHALLSLPESSDMQALAHDIYTDLVEDTCLGLSFEIHRAVKCGYFLLDETDPESMKDFEIIDQPGVDIFGQVYNQWKSKECVCPNCNRSIAASRFAPHLEKCLGMGRNSSRIANRRIASSNNMNKSESDQEDNDDVNDNDWSYGSEKKAKKRKSEKNPNSPRRSKSIKHKNGDLSVNTDPFKYSSSSGISYENLGPEELHTLLTTQCGVISEHTKKMCTRSLRCPQHTDDQRRSVRVYLLGSSASLPEPDGSTDNDSFDVVEGQGLMGRLPWDGSSDISPSDSASSKASTNNSDTRKPKKKKPSHISMGSAGGGGASKKKKPKAPAPHTPGMYSELN